MIPFLSKTPTQYDSFAPFIKRETDNVAFAYQHTEPKIFDSLLRQHTIVTDTKDDDSNSIHPMTFEWTRSTTAPALRYARPLDQASGSFIYLFEHNPYTRNFNEVNRVNVGTDNLIGSIDDSYEYRFHGISPSGKYGAYEPSSVSNATVAVCDLETGTLYTRSTAFYDFRSDEFTGDSGLITAFKTYLSNNGYNLIMANSLLDSRIADTRGTVDDSGNYTTVVTLPYTAPSPSANVPDFILAEYVWAEFTKEGVMSIQTTPESDFEDVSAIDTLIQANHPDVTQINTIVSNKYQAESGDYYFTTTNDDMFVLLNKIRITNADETTYDIKRLEFYDTTTKALLFKSDYKWNVADSTFYVDILVGGVLERNKETDDRFCERLNNDYILLASRYNRPGTETSIPVLDKTTYGLTSQETTDAFKTGMPLFNRSTGLYEFFVYSDFGSQTTTIGLHTSNNTHFYYFSADEKHFIEIDTAAKSVKKVQGGKVAF